MIAPERWQRFDTAEAVNDGLRMLLIMATLAKSEQPKRRKLLSLSLNSSAY